MIGDWPALSKHLERRGGGWLAAQICHLSSVPAAAGLFSPQLYYLFLPIVPPRLSAILSEPGAVIHVDGDEEEDSFDHVERDISAGEA